MRDAQRQSNMLGKESATTCKEGDENMFGARPRLDSFPYCGEEQKIIERQAVWCIAVQRFHQERLLLAQMHHRDGAVCWVRACIPGRLLACVHYHS